MQDPILSPSDPFAYSSYSVHCTRYPVSAYIFCWCYCVCNWENISYSSQMSKDTLYLAGFHLILWICSFSLIFRNCLKKDSEGVNAKTTSLSLESGDPAMEVFSNVRLKFWELEILTCSSISVVLPVQGRIYNQKPLISPVSISEMPKFRPVSFQFWLDDCHVQHMNETKRGTGMDR